MKKYIVWIIIGFVVLIILLNMKKLTGLVKNFKIRPLDKFGSGAFGASRGNRKHQGIDIIVTENEPIKAPFDLSFKRVTQPYKDDNVYKGGVYDSELGELKIFYMKPLTDKKTYKQGDIIGFAQNIAKKYGPEMHPHIHIELRKNGKLLNPTDYV